MYFKEDLIKKWQEDGLKIDEKLIIAFRKVPREKFVPKEMTRYAYDDVALPTINESTISQPTTIIIMLQALELDEDDTVLELGAGTGYSASLMAQLVKKVYTLEIDPALCEIAKTNLEKIKTRNVTVLCQDATLGLPEHAPFDKIVATAAMPKIPQSWIDQLKDEGIIVAPIGDKYSQVMMKTKKTKGKLYEEAAGNFRFIPAQGKYGF